MTKLKVGQAIKDFVKRINDNFTELDERKSFKLLYDGSIDIPAVDDEGTAIIQLYDDPSEYDGIILQIDDCCAYHHFGSLEVGTVFKPVHNQMDFTDEMKGWNMFGYNCEILSNNRLELSNFVYSGSNFDTNNYLVINELRYITQYSVYPLTKVIGIKFN